MTGARRRNRMRRARRRARLGPSDIVLALIEKLAAWGANNWRSLLRWETIGRRRSVAYRPARLSADERYALLHSGAVDRRDPAWRGKHESRLRRNREKGQRALAILGAAAAMAMANAP